MEKKIDREGRILIPEDIRRKYNLRAGDSVNISHNDKGIMLEPILAACCVCGGRINIETVDGIIICTKCIEKLKRN